MPPALQTLLRGVAIVFQTITVALPENLNRGFGRFLENTAGLAPDEVVGDATKENLFLGQFRSLRAKMKAKAKMQGIFTDQDVFARV